MNSSKVNFPGFEQERHPDEEKLFELHNKYPDFDVIAAYNETGNIKEIEGFLNKAYGNTRQSPVSSKLDNKKEEIQEDYEDHENFEYPNVRKAYNFLRKNLGVDLKKFEENLISKKDKTKELQEKYPNFDFEAALNEGGNMEDIQKFLSKFGDKQPKKEKSTGEKAGRLGAQYGLGLLQGTPSGMVWDTATAPLASKEAQNAAYRETLGEDLDYLMEKKAFGEWDEQDQALYDSIAEQLQDPSKSMEHVQTADISLRGLAEKASGVDLEPEGFLEKAANWSGMIKDWKKSGQLFKGGIKDTLKSFLPSGTDLFRGAGAGAAMQMAEEGQFGPLGTLGMAIVGDIVGHGPKLGAYIAKNPKQAAARAVNFATRGNSKKKITSELIDSLNKSNLKIDAGTLTDSSLVKSVQTRLSQSGLTGDALDNLRKEMVGSIAAEYENIAKDLGELVFQNDHQAAEAIKETLKVEELSLNRVNEPQGPGRSLQDRIDIQTEPPYQQEFLNRISPIETPNNYLAGERLKSSANTIKEEVKLGFERPWEELNNELKQVRATPQPELANELINFLDEHQGSLLLGKSSAEEGVLESAGELLEILVPNDSLRGVTLDELIKTKRTLADIANWEFHGSNYESAYKKLVGDIDRAIEKTLEEEAPHLLEKYKTLNAEYSAYKDFFENKNLKNLFSPKNENYYSLFNEFTTNPDKLKSLEDVFILGSKDQEVLNEIKRQYAQNALEKPNLTDRDFRNLQEVLGPEFQEPFQDFMESRQFQEQHPGPRAQRGKELGLEVPQERGVTKALTKERVKKAPTYERKKLYEELLNQSPEKIMKNFDTVQGIKKMKHVLSLTPEGKKLFKELSRYKIAELIDEKLFDGLTKQAKVGQFPNLLKNKETRQVVKELLGKENYERLRKLQSNTKLLNENAAKFFNASQSGTSLIDMGLVGTAFTGIFTGNPFMAAPALLKIGGSYYMAKLLADPVFLKELEKVIMTKNPKLSLKYMKELSDKLPAMIMKSDDNSKTA